MVTDRGPERTGVVRVLRLAGRSGEPMRDVDSAVAEVERGFVGDRHATRRPGHRRQLLLVDQAELDLLRLPGGVLKENVLLEGVPLESLEAGQRQGQSVPGFPEGKTRREPVISSPFGSCTRVAPCPRISSGE